MIKINFLRYFADFPTPPFTVTRLPFISSQTHYNFYIKQFKNNIILNFSPDCPNPREVPGKPDQTYSIDESISSKSIRESHGLPPKNVNFCFYKF